MDITKIKEQVRKLMDLAGDDAALQTHEAENALAFARRLMLKHNIDEAELASAKTPHEQAADEQYADAAGYSTFTRIMPWENVLATAIADLIGTTGVYIRGIVTKKTEHGTLDFDAKGKEQQRTQLVFYGPQDDARDARDLFAEWSMVIFAMARMKYGQAIRGDGRAYAAGFARSLWDKVQKLAKKERLAVAGMNQDLLESTGGGTALALTQGLALVAAKKEAAKKWLRKAKGIKLHSRSSSGPGFGKDAYGAGKSDGNKADFTHNRTKRLQG